jgi:glycosyltransferase involved in cell wall biosynthesis
LSDADPQHLPQNGPRVLIISDHASMRFGGEASLPWQYFRFLRDRGIDARLMVHARTREELIALRPRDVDRIHFLPDTALHRFSWWLSRFFPGAIGHMTCGYINRLSTQLAARKLARQLIREFHIDVVHQPFPVSPREPSLLHSLGVPVVIGPMNGDMSYPPAFAAMEGTMALSVGRALSGVMNRLMPGKRRAEILLVANKRTRRALPSDVRGEVIELVENGVDLSLWKSGDRRAVREALRCVFAGRLIPLKAVDVLLEALVRVPGAELQIIGDGPERGRLEAMATRLRVANRVSFVGWQSQAACAEMFRDADVLLFPSLHECGGAVVLEAMASGLPVIATKWGGPMDYVDESCGVLISPDSREALVVGFAGAMAKMIRDPILRHELGNNGRRRVERDFAWERKIDQILAIYRRAMERAKCRCR